MQVRLSFIGLLASLVVVGCASSAPPSSEVLTIGIVSPTPARNPSPPIDLATPSASGPSIVGEWHATLTCEVVVTALVDAGFAPSVPQFLIDGAFLPGVADVTAIKNPAKPCKGAVPRDHAHVFRSNGVFELLDWQGNQVDDGGYRIIGDGLLFIGDGEPTAQDVTFKFEVSGDALTLMPVIPPGCSTDPCLGDARWAATVAMGGTHWHRIP